MEMGISGRRPGEREGSAARWWQCSRSGQGATVPEHVSRMTGVGQADYRVRARVWA
jgi:hypothetical protein